MDLLNHHNLKRPEAGLLDKSSSIAAASGVTKFMDVMASNLVTLLS